MSSAQQRRFDRGVGSGIDSDRLLLTLAGVSKRYGGVVANDAIDLDVRGGKVLGLLGENGAGKSTLIAILSGMTERSVGTMSLPDGPYEPNGPADAIRAGIGTVYQHFALVPTLTVAEQLRLAGVRDGAEVVDLLDGIDRSALVADLSIGERQRLEIARVVGRRPDVLLLDEPTSTLDGSRVATLFDLIRRRREAGAGTVFVTHKLGEALDVCDRIVVLRRGAVVMTVGRTVDGWPESIETQLLAAMFGADPGRIDGGQDVAPGPAGIPGRAGAGDRPGSSGATLLEMRNVVDTGPPVRHRPVDIDLTVMSGEIVAIAGIDGQGQRELARLLAGHRRCRGHLAIAGVELAGQTAAGFAAAGVAYLTGDRRGEGMVARLPVAFNLLLRRQRTAGAQRGGVLRLGQVREEARRMIADWRIRPADPGVAAGTLSGGNMQKVLLARELATGPRLLVADNPTHGLDVRTQGLVRAALRSVTGRGGAVVLLTADLDEALRTADRVAVMSAGRLSPIRDVARVDRDELTHWMVDGW